MKHGASSGAVACGGDGHWYISGRNDVAVSRDDGATWQVVALPTKEAVFGACALPGGHAWLVGWAGTILRTVDGGATWKQDVSGTTSNLYGVWAAAPDRAFAVGQGGALLGWNGKAWVAVEHPAGDQWFRGVGGDARTVVVVGYGAGALIADV